MKIADKIQIKNAEYMCTQIIALKELMVYRVHEITGDNELFITENNNNCQEITDKKTLQEIRNLITPKKTDFIVNIKK